MQINIREFKQNKASNSFYCTIKVSLSFRKKILFKLIYDWGKKTLVMMGGGLKVPSPFLFVNPIEKVLRLCTVLKKKLFDWQF